MCTCRLGYGVAVGASSDRTLGAAEQEEQIHHRLFGSLFSINVRFSRRRSRHAPVSRVRAAETFDSRTYRNRTLLLKRLLTIIVIIMSRMELSRSNSFSVNQTCTVTAVNTISHDGSRSKTGPGCLYYGTSRLHVVQRDIVSYILYELYA